ncbi:MAG: hypothetical protein KAI66_07930 [Lentisphaeria bacterium]|nr:hypothetical protein [Lentisphaeria bacterium]
MDQLVRARGVEEAYQEAVKNRDLLRRLILRAEKELEKAGNTKELAELRAQLVRGRKQYADLKDALDLVFGLGERRDYEYDPVKSTIYLRVGTIAEVFTNALRSRDVLAMRLAGLQARLESEKDATVRVEMQRAVESVATRHDAYVRALGMIYGLRTGRDYVYNSRDATIYIKMSKTELEAIRSQRKKLRMRQEGEKASGGAAVSDRSLP